MAARSRPRAGQQRDEIDEEQHLWNTIRADGKRFDQLMVSLFRLYHATVAYEISGAVDYWVPWKQYQTGALEASHARATTPHHVHMNA